MPPDFSSPQKVLRRLLPFLGVLVILTACGHVTT